jgi:hypothetical protein
MIRKITHGFVIQNFDEVSGECINQEFIAGSNVSWEDGFNSPIEPNLNCEYFPFHMLQPGDKLFSD